MPRDHYLSLGALRVKPWSVTDILSSGARTYSCFMARNAIYHSLCAMGIKPGERVLVPAFICSVVVEAILAYGAQADYYDVDRLCQVPLDHSLAQIKTDTKALLAVHYFGFPQRIKEVRDLCQRRGIFLIEDCAHVLCGEIDGQPMGSFGDAAVFSWRKFLPTYDGGELVLNNPDLAVDIPWGSESALFSVKVAKNMTDQFIESGAVPFLSHPNRWLRGAKGALCRLFQASESEQGMLAADINNVSFNHQLVHLPMSRLSRWVLRHADIVGICAARRRNYLRLLSEIKRLKGVTPLHEDLPRDVCPWVFPVVFDGMKDAHIALRQLGVPAANWSGARYHGIPKDTYSHAEFLYDNLVFLPIHQSLAEQHLSAIVNAVEQVRSSI